MKAVRLMLLARQVDDGILFKIVRFSLGRHSDQHITAQIMRLRTSHVLRQLLVNTEVVAGTTRRKIIELRVSGDVIGSITDSRLIHLVRDCF